jgi:hypothetical protein
MADQLNVLDYSPVLLPSGDLDITQSLLHILANHVPAAGQFLPNSDRRQNAAVIHFPSLDGRRCYVITDTVALPGTKNVRLAAAAPFGARLELRRDASVDEPAAMFVSQKGPRAHSFENLILQGGGVRIHGSTAGPTVFRSCVFTAIPGFAIATLDPAVVRVTIANCQFVETDRGVQVLHRACDNWLIADNTTFVRLAGVGVDMRSSGVTLRDVRFESRQALEFGGTVADEPYIIIRSPPADQEGEWTGGLDEICSCRFGGEVGHDLRDPSTDETEEKPLLPGPPQYAIEIGPNEVGSIVTGMRIIGNWFLGRTHEPGPTPESALGAIRVHERLVESVAMGNFFRPYYGPLIVEDTASDGDARNLFVANALPKDATESTVFSAGAANWQVLPALPPP